MVASHDLEGGDSRQPLAWWWPLFGLRIVTPRLELRAVADTDLPEIAQLLRHGVHDPDEMPFNTPWTDSPEPALQREAFQWLWSSRVKWSVESWSLPFVVSEHGRIVGMQDVAAEHFPLLRTVETGSWVTRPLHGRGIGKEMRAAVLHFSFEGLGAHRAETSAFDNNPASLAVTRSLGYLPNGETHKPQREHAGRQLLFVMPRDAWLHQRRSDIELHGLDAARPMFAPADPVVDPVVDTGRPSSAET